MTITGTVEYRPLGVLGAEIPDVDLSGPLSTATIGAFRKVLLERELLLFRNQQLSDSAFIEFARSFGVLDTHSLKHFAPPGCLEILILSNRVEDGRPLGLVEVGHFWHSDGSFLPQLDMFTTLYGVEIPTSESGTPLGNTLFISATAAYDGLTADEQRELEGLQAVFSYDFRLQQRLRKNPAVRPARAKPETKDQHHPVIRAHPVTGKKTLFVNEGYTTRIEGLPESRSQELLNKLLQHLYSGRYEYRHRWQPGDVLIWDNNSTQHNAVSDYRWPQARCMKRITIKSEHPQATHAA